MDPSFRFPLHGEENLSSEGLLPELRLITPGSTQEYVESRSEPYSFSSPSETTWNLPLDNLNFLNFVNGNATLVIAHSDGTFSSIQGLDVNIIAERCPLLAFSFEAGELGLPRASIESYSRNAVVCFLRFLYTGDYLEGIENCSMLVHAHLCSMAEIFEVPELQVLAHANVIQETEMSCSRPTPPEDLCNTIRFIFNNLSDQKPLIDTILHYCVFCFLYHGLGKNEDFKRLTFEVASFTKQLCRTSFYRGFDDEGAIDIVRLQTCDPTPQLRNKVALGDFLYEMHGVDSFSDVEGKLRSQRRTNEKENAGSNQNLAHRPKQVLSDDESENEKGPFGFTLVHRPKTKRDWVDCGGDYNCSSSDPGSDVDTMLATSNYKDEDEYWGTKSKLRVKRSDPQDQDEHLEDSFLTIKPLADSNRMQPQQAQRRNATNEGGYNSDSDWSLV